MIGTATRKVGAMAGGNADLASRAGTPSGRAACYRQRRRDQSN